MLSVGYMAKRVVQRPNWLNAPNVQDIYSVSDHASRNFMDYIEFWRHNGYWLFDTPQIIQELSLQNNLDQGELTFFYYEVYEQEFENRSRQWRSFEPEEFPTNVISPTQKEFCGYDVVTFSVGTSPECSPLSCNSLAREIRTNSHCLLNSMEEAKKSLEEGQFDQGEPGPFRIFAVYRIDPNHWRD